MRSKKNTAIVLLFLFVFTGVNGQTADVRIVVDDIKGTAGRIMIALFDNPSGFKSKTNPFRAAELEIENHTVSYRFKKVPPGNYAVAVYHDANGDGVLNTRSMKIPAEGVGVSGSPSGKLKIPRFEDAVFSPNNDTLIVIRMIYPAPQQ
ncbi:MAG: DUF2141 domain-containing protein [Bacteroidales bacterium]|nr:DUF2141 domain-containing protein [Bacteroidales bacterium]MCF6341672.1 DUF2141 domain-containing protein [Bacteroidales bacterium]